MSIVHITEYAELSEDNLGNQVLAGKEPALATQRLFFSIAANSATFNSRTRFALMDFESDTHYVIDQNPNATEQAPRKKAGTAIMVGVRGGVDSVSVFDGAAGVGGSESLAEGSSTALAVGRSTNTATGSASGSSSSAGVSQVNFTGVGASSGSSVVTGVGTDGTPPVGTIVNNNSELTAALSAATGGELILCADGDYGSVNWSHPFTGNFSKASIVTIQSLNGKNAVFDTITMSACVNIRIQSVTVATEFVPAVPPQTLPLTANIRLNNNCDTIEIVGNEIYTKNGEAPHFTTGHYGINSHLCDNILFEANDVHHVLIGGALSTGDNYRIRFNYFHNLGGDTFNLPGLTNSLIEGNFAWGYYKPDLSFHSDFMQVWTSLPNSSGIGNVFRGNCVIQQIYTAEGGNDIQNLLLNDEASQGHQDITVEHNVCWTNAPHGLWHQNTNGLTVTNNSVLSVHSSASVPPNTSSIFFWGGGMVNVTAENNLTQNFAGDALGVVTLINNKIFTDAEYPALFGIDANNMPTVPNDLIPLAPIMQGGVEVGAPRSTIDNIMAFWPELANGVPPTGPPT